MRKNEKGFTLVELIVVIAIVAILASVGIVGYTQFISNARNTKAQAELDQIVNVLRAEASVDPIVTRDADGDGDVPLEIGNLKISFDKGKLVFAKNTGETAISAEDLAELMNYYAADFEGTLELENNKLTLKVGGGTGSTVVTYSGEPLSAKRGSKDDDKWVALTDTGDEGQ